MSTPSDPAVGDNWNPIATTTSCDWCGECDWCLSGFPTERPDSWGVKVWRAWDHEWVAECFAHGEVHWGGRWMDAMVVAWGHLAMHHEARP